MAEAIPVKELFRLLEGRAFPSITGWNRLEGRPRTVAFDRALRAEVRDALWMLSRQWQLGEFHGEDAGSPVLARMHLERTALTGYRPGEHAAEPFDATLPLEAEVERRPARFGLDLRLALGRYWLKLIASVGDFRQAYLDRYPVAEPDPASEDDADRAAHVEVFQAFAAAAGRGMDGGELLEHLRAAPGNRAADGIPGASAAQAAALDERGDRFVAWAARVFTEPPATGEDAWTPERMEYRFACSAPTGDGRKVFTAEEYRGGHLDWYSLDVDLAAPPLEVPGDPPPDLPAGPVLTAIPTAVEFEGMPNARWWAFEDRRTNFGAVDASTTDVAKLLFLEFGLIYSNDWLVLPFTLPAGSVATMRGLAITNVFGDRTWIEPAGSGPDDAWQRWTMFNLSVAGRAGEASDRSLLLLPTVANIQEAGPAEEVLLVRDEMANMAWGVEQTVALPDGRSSPGAELAAETLEYHRRLRGGPPPPPPIENEAPVRYQAMTTVPENWIPFANVRVPGSVRAIQLQRAALPRLIEGDAQPPTIVRPRTSLLREGLDETPQRPYFLFEEEVPRAGARVTQSWQRTRWYDGSVVLWVGARKGTGRSPASSGLAFDQLIDLPPADADAVVSPEPPDTEAPAPPTIGAPPEASYNRTGAFSVTGTAEPQSTVRLYEGTAVRGSGQAAADGSWTIALSAVPEGTHRYTATATDAAGNTSPPSAARTVTVDRTPPAPPAITAPPQASYNRSGAFSVTGTAEPQSTVRLYEGTAVRGSAQAAANGSWTIALSNVPEGKHPYRATATDAAGNASAASQERTVTVDKTTPTVTAVTPRANATGVTPTANVTATFSEAMRPASINRNTFTLVRRGTTTKVAAVVRYEPANRRAVLDPTPPLGRGAAYTATITAGVRDLAGNPLAAPRRWSFTVRR